LASLPRRRSLRVHLPMMISAFIAIVLGTFLWVAFREVQSALLEAGGTRAQAAAGQLSDLLAQSAQQRLAEVQTAARSASIREYLQHRGDATEAAARQRLTALAAPGQPAVEVADEHGAPLLSVMRPPLPGATVPEAPPALPAWQPPFHTGLSAFRLAGATVLWDVVSEIRDGATAGAPGATGQLRGYLLTRRLLSLTSASDAISRLVGSGAVVMIGNQDGTAWIDLTKIVAPPPVNIRAAGLAEYRAADGSTRLGAMAPIRGTVWGTWVEFPRSAVVAPARVFLTRMAIIGLFFVTAAAVVARALSARITTPLHDLTEAAEMLAAGHPVSRVETARRDEIGRLGAAFNSMAAQVQVVQRELEERVRQRTVKLEESAAALERHIGELNETRQDLDGFFNLSPDLLCIAGTDGYFKRVNPACCAVLGWTERELRDQPYLTFVHPDDRTAAIDRAASYRNDDAGVTFENRYRCRDGSYRWLQWNLIPVHGRELLYASARDITEQKATDAKVRALNEELEQRVGELGALTQELEAFSYSVSHDLRAPLRHVTGFTTLLERSARDRLVEKEARYVRTIVDAATRMGRLIDDLLAFSRMGRTPVRRQRVALNELVRDAQADLSRPAGSPEIAWIVPPLPEVDADPALLRQVFVNLLSNAAKYSGSQPQPAIEVGVSWAQPDETVIFVRDNGVGFDMQYVDKLFGVFQRLHSSDAFEGTGIGLANVRRIIHRHGGRVWAEGTVDAGATFYFSLPRHGAQ
jgi:PAS domain S-box-containing protein